MDKLHLFLFRLCQLLLGFLWGTALWSGGNLLVLNTSHHPAVPLVALAAVLLLVMLAPRLSFGTGRPWGLMVLLHAGLLMGALSLTASSGLMYMTMPAGLTGSAVLIWDGLAILILSSLPVLSAYTLKRRLAGPALVLTGVGMGLYISGGYLLQFHSGLLIAGLSAAGAIICGFICGDRPEPATHEPWLRNRPLAAAAMGLLAGTGFIWLVYMRSINSRHITGLAGAPAMLCIAAALGSALAQRLRENLRPSVRGALLVLSGLTLTGGILLSRILQAQGLLTPGGIAVPLLTVLIPALAAAAALIPAPPGPGARPPRLPFLGPLLLGAGFAAIAAFGLLGGITAALLGGGIAIALTGLLWIAVNHPPRKQMHTLAAALIATPLFVMIGSSARLHQPLVYESGSLALTHAHTQTRAAALAAAYRVKALAENAGGYRIVLEDRETLVPYVYHNGELLYPDEFHQDNADLLFILPRLLAPAGPDILYGGPLTPACREGLAALPGELIVAHPGPLPADAKGFRAIRRDLRGVLNTGGAAYDLIINVPPLPALLSSHGRYSYDFFKAAAARLKPGGRLIQFLPCYKTAPEIFNRIIASFAAACPGQASIWVHENYCVLTGGPQPAPVGYDDLKRAFAAGPTGIFRSVAEVTACFSRPAAELSAAGLLRDRRPDLLYTRPAQTALKEVLYHNYQLVAARLRGAAGFTGGIGVPADADIYRQGREALAQARLSWLNGDIKQSEARTADARGLNPDDSQIIRFQKYIQYTKAVGLARDYHSKGNLKEALQHYQHAGKFQLHPAYVLAAMGRLYWDRSRETEWPASFAHARTALDYLALAVQDRPDFPRAQQTAVRALIQLRLLKRAGELLEHLRQSDPEAPYLHELQQAFVGAGLELAAEPDPATAKVIAAAAASMFASREKAREHMSALIAAGPAGLPYIQKDFDTQEKHNKKHVLQIMTRIGGDAVTAFVSLRMTAEAPLTTPEAFDVMRMYGGRDEVTILAAFTRPSYPDHVRTRAVITLASMRHPDAIPHLIRALADPQAAVASEALNALQTVHPMFADLAVDSLKKDVIIELERAFSELKPEELLWPPYLGE